MTLQSELKLPWPELSIHFPVLATQTVSETSAEKSSVEPASNIDLNKLWERFRSTFHGKYSRFASYLMYLSTDFSGGFKVCSFLGIKSIQNTFQFSPGSSALSLDAEGRDKIWAFCKRKEWEEIDREDWELLGLSFLLTGDTREFSEWVQMTNVEFGLSDDCKRYLTLLSWESFHVSTEATPLHSLYNYTLGAYEKVDFLLLAGEVLKQGNVQIAGVLLDAIEKGVWHGEEILPFLEFIAGNYDNWKDWEKAKFLNLTLGKLPPFLALKKAKKILPKERFLEYTKSLKLNFRGDFEKQELESGSEVSVRFDPFIVTLIRYDRERDAFRKEIAGLIALSPYSYFLNLQMALVSFKDRDFEGFLNFYEKGGRLRYLPTPLYFYARAQKERKEDAVAESILNTLEKLSKIPVFPKELSEI
jgi:hypothetical protein